MNKSLDESLLHFIGHFRKILEFLDKSLSSYCVFRTRLGEINPKMWLISHQTWGR